MTHGQTTRRTIGGGMRLVRGMMANNNESAMDDFFADLDDWEPADDPMGDVTSALSGKLGRRLVTGGLGHVTVTGEMKVSGVRGDVRYDSSFSPDGKKMGVTIDVWDSFTLTAKTETPDDLASAIEGSIGGIEDAIRKLLEEVGKRFDALDMVLMATDPDSSAAIGEIAGMLDKTRTEIESAVKRAS